MRTVTKQEYMSKQLQIRNSTAEFLIFQAEDKAQGVQVFYHDENIWATQKAMAELYGIDKSGISRHLANIYESGELRPEMTVAKFATVVNRGIRGEVTTWENAPSGKIVKTDVSIAKNYLKQNELEDMGNIVSAVLDFAEARAKRHIPMTMEDWAKRIDAYLNSDERPLLTDAGSVSREAAQEYAETEFEKYRVIQDRLFESDFDRFALPTLPFEDNEEKLK